MAKPSNLAVLAMHQEMSDRSQVFSVMKLGECLLKYNSLVSITRLVSWLNASEWLCVSTLCKGSISCHFELGGPSEVALDVVPPKGMMSPRCGERCHHLHWGECSGAREEGATGADTYSVEEAPCERVNGRNMGTCPINMW